MNKRGRKQDKGGGRRERQGEITQKEFERMRERERKEWRQN